MSFFQVVEHVPDPRRFLSEARTLVAPGGFLIVSVPNRDGIFRLLPYDPANMPPHHVSRWRQRDLERLAAACDLCAWSNSVRTCFTVEASPEFLAALHNRFAAAIGLTATPRRFVAARPGLLSLPQARGEILLPAPDGLSIYAVFAAATKDARHGSIRPFCSPARTSFGPAFHTAELWRDEADHAYIAIHLIERSIAALAPRLRGELLDVGCGRQPYRNYFSHMTKITACDHDGARGAVDFTCPAHAIPVPAASFDAILSTEVLEHVPDPLAVWREFHRVLRPGGRVLLTVPMYWPSHEVPYDFCYPAILEHGLRYLASNGRLRGRGNLAAGRNVWAFLGQVVMQVLGHYFPLPIPCAALGIAFFSSIDRKRE